MYGTDDTKQLAKAGSIQNAPHYAGVHREKRRVVCGVSCERDNPSSRTESAYPADHIDPRHPAPAQVNQSDVGLVAKEAMNGVVRITGFANHREIRLSSDRLDQSFANETMLRDVHQTDGHRRHGLQSTDHTEVEVPAMFMTRAAESSELGIGMFGHAMVDGVGDRLPWMVDMRAVLTIGFHLKHLWENLVPASSFKGRFHC